MVFDHVGDTDGYLFKRIGRLARDLSRSPGFVPSDEEDTAGSIWTTV
jgi:hypothetical protein